MDEEAGPSVTQDPRFFQVDELSDKDSEDDDYYFSESE